jgi:hypothetical protein
MYENAKVQLSYMSGISHNYPGLEREILKIEDGFSG